ncbi:hypothetical protein [Mycolicibacterium conceptionense]|uniref:Transmembrane protein n=1 Tax=Mycolicibacterium conceptionense TaxID=451644 RepID=A0A1A1YK90_9MYCO|nr:hypothetical protein [Mycolicibacterium conceptionense]OBF14376.1 hypothetical protein A5726_24755 [Mycolicibacterium conceptionense]OBF31732.1 hypothetical protein A5720_28290 [Mycolicibacterium conceptionense]OBH96994.1 hypothetical protein A5716_16635 [Mycolicibacterium conceptionense]
MSELPPAVVAVLPKPRKSRHPWQWCICTGLLILAVSQLTIGPLPASSLAAESVRMTAWLNIQTLVACGFCLCATWVHDGWLRLGVEFAGQTLAASVFGYYAFISWQRYGLADGLGLAMTVTGAIALAAILRAGQIACTMHKFRRAFILSTEQAREQVDG